MFKDFQEDGQVSFSRGKVGDMDKLKGTCGPFPRKSGVTKGTCGPFPRKSRVTKEKQVTRGRMASVTEGSNLSLFQQRKTWCIFTIKKLN